MKIAIIKLSALGDIVHGSIVLQFIKKHIPHASIHWVCEEKFCDILHNHEHIDRVISIRLKEKKIKQSYLILQKEKKNNYDIAIDLQGLIKSAIIGRILCKNVVGFDKNSIRERFAAMFYAKSFQVKYEKNIIMRNLELTSQALGFAFTEKEIELKEPCFPLFKKEKKSKEKKSILLVIGSSWKSKIYPVKRQIELLSFLQDFEVWIVFGNNEEQMMAKKIARATHAGILQKMTIRELAMKMNEFDIVVGPDSGITHLAWAQNIPSVTIYGPTPSYRNTYVTNQNVVIDSKKRIDAKKIDKNSDCIDRVKPIDIARLIREIV